MKIYIPGIVIVAALLGCEQKEKVALQHKVDSLKFELVTIKEVGLLIDSIDESRKFLQVKIMEGDNYANHVSRLQEINRYIQKSEVKLKPLEEFNKNPSKVSASTITQLKADLENQIQEVVALQVKVANLNKSNIMLWTMVHEMDSIWFTNDQVIKLKERDIANLALRNVEIRESNQITMANLYFAQAVALEEAANHIQFAPNKKKATQREALELFKLSLSLGNQNALVRIDDLEKKLS